MQNCFSSTLLWAIFKLGPLASLELVKIMQPLCQPLEEKFKLRGTRNPEEGGKLFLKKK